MVLKGKLEQSLPPAGRAVNSIGQQYIGIEIFDVASRVLIDRYICRSGFKPHLRLMSHSELPQVRFTKQSPNISNSLALMQSI